MIAPVAGQRWRHVARGTTYAVVGVAHGQGGPLEGCPIVVYRDSHGGLWARSQTEFCDGRFELSLPSGDGYTDATSITDIGSDRPPLRWRVP